MANGTYFSSGNHPVETLVPMLHLDSAGFECEIFTLTGQPVQFEMWIMPSKDKNVQTIYKKYQEQCENPQSLTDLVDNGFAGTEEYIAIYIPGGHGALLDLPHSQHVSTLLTWAHENDLFTLSICHGPAALLADTLNEETPCIYSGYSIAAFPDSGDRQTPVIGYMPGQLTWFFGEKLKENGVKIVNTKADKSCHVDRRLVTGASPQVANEFGKLATRTLLSALS